MGTPVTIRKQPRVIDDLLSPARLKDDAFAKIILQRVADAEIDPIADGLVYLNQGTIYVAVALAVAGYITFEYDGSGALKRCGLTEAGRSLLGR